MVLSVGSYFAGDKLVLATSGAKEVTQPGEHSPGGLRIISPQGKVLGQLIVPETVANVGFAEDGKTVYLTGSTSLYRLKTKVAGETPMYYKR